MEDELKFKSLHLWTNAARFHGEYIISFFPIYPLFFIPLVNDALHSLIIKKALEESHMSIKTALKEVWGVIPPLLAMKIVFWFKGTLWSFVPVYGIIKCAHYYIYSVMASNVLVFEGLSGEEGRNRCSELYEIDPDHLGTRTFVTIPGLILVLMSFLMAAGVEIVNSNLPFWIFILFMLWIFFPVSGALNTFYYLRFREYSESLDDRSYINQA